MSLGTPENSTIQKLSIIIIIYYYSSCMDGNVSDAYNDSLTGFHEPLSPPYRCHTGLKKAAVQSLIVSHGVPDHTVCVKSTAHGHLHDTATAHLSAAVPVYRIVS